MVVDGSKTVGVMQAPVTWAQRKNLVYLTFNVEDVKKPELKVDGQHVFFRGKRGDDQLIYEADLPLYAEIDPESSKQLVTDRKIEVALIKKNQEGPFWPRLIKDSSKRHWIKVDFGKWQDEDDSDDEANGEGGGNGMDMDAMMRQMGGLSGLGGDDKPGMDDLEDDEDSDDGDLPELTD